MRDDLNAFVGHDDVHMRGRPGGPLGGLTFAAKDIFDVAGHVTGCGNPTWRDTHDAASATASAVQLLLDAGAELVGKTHTNELAYSVTGENAHYGTPVNVNAPGRVPGGSSSGSAAAVAGGLVDVALGSDTGGSVRIPASFCGIYGLRTTHGRIALDGVMPLAPSFDTAGWFARDGELMRKVGLALLPAAQEAAPPRRLLIARDAFDFVAPAVAEALAPAIDAVRPAFAEIAEISASGGSPADWLTHFRILQAREVWQCHGEWVQAQRPQFGPGVRERFAAAAEIRDDEVADSSAARARLRQRLDDLLAPDVVIGLPTAPGIAPLCGAPEAALDDERQRILSLTSLAGLAGCPQITLPVARLEGCPLGLSFIAGRGRDEMLLDLAVALADRWPQPVAQAR